MRSVTWGFEEGGAARCLRSVPAMGVNEAAEHIPVMRDEIVAALAERETARPLRLVDCTLGLGGHAEALLAHAPAGSELLGLDRDAAALARAAARLEPFGARFTAVQAPFSRLAQVLEAQGWDAVDGVLADLGVSSMQLDEVERGFSFRADAPLDMRMDTSRGESAAELLARVDEVELTGILRRFGEEPAARRIARAIVQSEARPTTTRELQELVERVAGGPRHRRRRINPATLTFQALRIAVNEELSEIETWLDALPAILRAGGRVAVLAYHSLEDRRVKNVFRSWARACVCPPELLICRCGGEPLATALVRGAAKPSEEEIAANPRARSARLRMVEWEGRDGR